MARDDASDAGNAELDKYACFNAFGKKPRRADIFWTSDETQDRRLVYNTF